MDGNPSGTDDSLFVVCHFGTTRIPYGTPILRGSTAAMGKMEVIETIESRTESVAALLPRLPANAG
jgi:hypothetical protein